MNFLRPARNLLGVFLHELLDAALVGLDHAAHFRADLVIFFAADLAVTPHALDQIVPEMLLAERL